MSAKLMSVFSGDFISYGKLRQGVIIKIMKACGTLRVQMFKEIYTNLSIK